MPDLRAAAQSRRIQTVAAFVAVYIIWGSTYLAIRFADATLPPFLMAGSRFLIAGAVLYAWMRLRGASRPGRVHWQSAIVVGLLLLVGGNGVVVWAERVVPSSLAALLISTVPIWMALMDWLRPGGRRPSLATFAGLALGFVGVALLIGPGTGAAVSFNPLYAGIVILASISWAAGSLYSRGAKMPPAPLVGTAMEMLAGGAVLLALGLVTGESAHLNLHAVSVKSALAFLFLIIFGSLVAYSAYVWLLRNVAPARVSTYAYVNPVVAVFLGWAFDSEQLTVRTLLAAAVIVAGVLVITTFRTHSASPAASTGSPVSDGVSSHHSREHVRPVGIGD